MVVAEAHSIALERLAHTGTKSAYKKSVDSVNCGTSKKRNKAGKDGKRSTSGRTGERARESKQEEKEVQKMNHNTRAAQERTATEQTMSKGRKESNIARCYRDSRRHNGQRGGPFLAVLVLKTRPCPFTKYPYITTSKHWPCFTHPHQVPPSTPYAPPVAARPQLTQALQEETE